MLFVPNIVNLYELQRSIFNPFMTEAVIYRNQSIDLLHKSMDWFLYDNGLRHERVKYFSVDLIKLEFESKERLNFNDILW